MGMMDIHKTKPGDRIVYRDASDCQVRWGGNSDPRGMLVVGAEYVVGKIEIHSQHTKVYLVGVDEKFNSVCFQTPIEEEKP